MDGKDNISRRNFLKRIWAILGVIVSAEILVIIVSFMLPRSRSNANRVSAKLRLAGSVDNFEPGSITPFRSGQFYLARFEDGGFLAISLKCSHLGCSVMWDSSKKQFICPCHSSLFDDKGNVLRSPAPRALDVFPVVIENGSVYVDSANVIKRKRFDKTQLIYA